VTRGDGADGPDGAVPVDTQLSRIRAEIGANTQVVLITPLCDDEASRIAQRFERWDRRQGCQSGRHHDGDRGGRLARLERTHRLSMLRNAGIPVVDWTPTQPLGAAMAAVEGWGR